MVMFDFFDLLVADYYNLVGVNSKEKLSGLALLIYLSGDVYIALYEL